MLFQRTPEADVHADPHSTDPGILKKHSTFRSYTTAHATYPSIRTFYRPHPQANKLPSEPTPIPLLVFVHGLGGSLAQFKAVLTSLVDLAPCLGIDLPGCGRSEFAPATWPAYSSEALVELLQVAIAEHVIPGQGVVLIGHSLGCSLSALVATSLRSGSAESLDFLGLLAICPPPEIRPGLKITILKSLLSLPDPLFNLFRAWDRRGGPLSASVSRFVGTEADIEVKKLQERFNVQSRTPVYRRMAWGVFPQTPNTVGMATLQTWAALKIPTFLIGGEADQVTEAANVTKIVTAIKGSRVSARGEDAEERWPDLQHESDFEGANASMNPDFDTSSAQTHDSGDHTILQEHTDYTHRLPVLKSSILPSPASHGLLYDPTTSRTLSGLIQNFLSSHIDTRLSLAFQLQHLTTEGKWDVKNLEKWRLVAPISAPIGGLFRAMKTLREVDLEHSPEQFARQWKGTVEAVVDISHDSPVYDPKGLEDRGIEYHKFPTVSKIPPTRDEIKEFNILIDRIRNSKSEARGTDTRVEEALSVERSQGSEEAGSIGVHCHYGFNRTGFFICSYLIEREHFTIHAAVDEFAAKRPPGIKHPHFLDELFVRYCVGLKRAPTL